MKITKNMDGTHLTVAVEGELDTLNAHELEEALMGSLDGVTELTIDLADLNYTTSSGLRVLVKAHKAMYDRGVMRVVNVNDIVQEIFSITGLDNVLRIE